LGARSVQNRSSHLVFPAPPGAEPERENTMLCAPLLAAARAAEAQPTHDASPTAFTALLFVFLLATFIGLGVVTRVSRLLHTPLMSLTNAISAIAVVGSIVIAGQDHPPIITLLGAIALAASMTNIVSGFLITDRMLRMFKKPGEEKRP
jgi:NAD(P) transhydrogenase subunit alpha